MRISGVVTGEAARVAAGVSVADRSATLSFPAVVATLFKLRVGALITFTAVVGALVAGDGRISLTALGWLAFSVGVTCAGSGCLNHYFDRDIDARMERTRLRPLPAGHVRHPRTVLFAGAVLIAAGLLAAGQFLNAAVAFYGLLGAVIYIGVYTLWLKRRTVWNIVIGGLAGSVAVVAGGAAVPSGVTPAVLALAAAVFLWTPPHFWSLAIAYEDDYRRAGVPMLPVVAGRQRTARAILISTLLLIAVTLGLVMWQSIGWPFLLAALAGGGLLALANIRLIRRPTRREALRNFHLSNLYLFLIFLAALVSVWL